MKIKKTLELMGFNGPSAMDDLRESVTSGKTHLLRDRPKGVREETMAIISGMIGAEYHPKSDPSWKFNPFTGYPINWKFDPMTGEKLQ